MRTHFRSSLFLLIFSLLFCAVLYPLVVLGIGQVVFPNKADGSLIDAKGQPVSDPAKAVGSRLIAQPFAGDEYFQPRPSAASYNAAASAASNWGGSNYLLRERVAQALGPIVKYGRQGARPGQPVGPDVEEWLHADPAAVERWAAAHADAPERWLKADKANAALVAAWKKGAAKGGEPAAEDVVPFFRALAEKPPAEWPTEAHAPAQAVFFESWREAHPDADLEPVPADMVTASGSGLDPDITLKAALYQLDRVAGKWAELTKRDPAAVRQEIEQMLNERAEAPLGGLAGVKLVNVLETDLALRERYAGDGQASR